MEGSAASNPQTGRFVIPGLDGIRALAVLTVFLYHAQIVPHIPGELGTTVFFFLSGFLITTLFLREWKKTGDVRLGAFYFRRALRILPPLYIALALALVASLVFHVGQGLNGLYVAGNFFHFTNYAMAFGPDKVGFLPGMILLWSLAVDEHYYLFYAPLFKAAIKRISVQKMALGVLFLCAAALVWRCYLVYVDGGASTRESMATDTRVDSILWGALLALWRNPALAPSSARFLAKPIPIMLGIVGLLVVDLSKNWDFIATWGYTIQGLALIPLFTVAMIYGGQGLLKFLNWPFMMWVSKISYGLYLFQWLMLEVCFKYAPGPRVVQFLIAFVSAFALASAMHLYIERPMARLRKEKAAKKQPALSPVSMPEAA